jgi:hypothetical protein
MNTSHSSSPDRPITLPVAAAGLVLAAAASTVSAQCGYDLVQASTQPTNGGPTASVFADYSGDGVLDIAVACNSAGAVMFYPGIGNGAFSNGFGFGAGANPYDLCTGDFNGDGRPDFASTGHNGGYCLYINSGGAPSITSVVPTPAVNPQGICTADFNGDGRLDLAMTSSGTASVWVMLGLGNGQFGPPEGFSTGGIPVGVAAGDLNGDGRPDLAVCNSSSGNITLLYRTSGGTFAPQAPMATAGVGQPRAIALGDLDGDGKLDLAVGGTGTPNFITIYRTPEFGYGPGITRQVGNSGVSVGSVKVADMNADGRLDVVATGGNQLTTLINAGGFQGNFTPHIRGMTDTSARGIAIGDLTGDGLLDVAAVQPSFGTYLPYRNITNSTPLVTQWPQRTQTTVGTPVSLFVTATGTGSSGSLLSYRWKRDGVQISNTDPAYSGAHSATLTILSPTLADHLSVFDVTVSNLCGTTTSPTVGLGVVEACGDSDFDGDGDFGTDADIEAFFRVLGGGGC